MRIRVLACVVLLLLTGATISMAQGTQTGTLRGTVTTVDKATVPGATVTIKSTALIAARSVVTESDGAYLFMGLPPGTYTISVTKTGMPTFEKKAEVALGNATELSVVMNLPSVSENVKVTAEAGVLSTPTVGANIKSTEVNALANPRNLTGIANLSPGVTMNTPNARQLVINGSFAYDNVFLINGVDVNDNLFGSPQNLFIEDAIQETQVLTSGISAEYGRFTGGVVNAITKSGGNMFSGSFRTNLSNPTWSTLTPFDVENGVTHTSRLNKTHETTLGGPLMKNRAWFFAAGRLSHVESQETFSETGILHTDITDNKRGEIKLTVSPRVNSTFSFNYINSTTKPTAPPFDFSIDPLTIYAGNEPNSLIAANWRGLVRPGLFAEVGYSQRKFAFLNEGGTSTDIVNSPMIGLSLLTNFNAPYFDATDPENRDNRQVTGNLSYSFMKAGRHDIKLGYEWFRSHHTGGNSQSSTNYVFDIDYAIDATGAPIIDGTNHLIPVFQPGKTLLENWLPVRGAVSNVDTNSLFVQDHWAVASNLSLDLGLRFEAVRSEATGGILGVDTTTIVPRVALAFDPKGDGKLVFHATYAHYAGKYNETLIGGNNNVGNPDLLLGVYVGPAGQGRTFAAGFNPANYVTVFGRFPTANVSIAPGMSSPITKEFTVSAGAPIRNGTVQATYVWRTTSNFIDDVINIANGTTDVVKQGVDIGTFTNIIFTNSNVPQRDYQGLVFQGRYDLRHNVTVAGNWTVQLKNDGSFEGEATNQPGIPTLFNDYPGANGAASIYDPARHTPSGHLNSYQRSKVRLWAIWSTSMGRAGTLGVSGMLRVESARVYSLAATGEPLTAIQNALLATAGYPDAPSSQTIFFGDRGEQSFKGYGLFDTSINYDIPVLKSLRPWLKVDIFNLFNNLKMISWNTTISPDYSGPVDSRGLPLNFIEGASFGTATSAGNFPQAFQGQTGGRTIVMAFGFRF